MKGSGKKVIKSSEKLHKKTFKEDYFTDYYLKMTGQFELNDLMKNKNWFYGWFDAIKNNCPITKGKGKRALEVGCAIGAASAILAERGFDVLATDISEYAVKNARKLQKDVRFEQMDIEKTKKYSNKYDLIIAFEVIEHLRDPEKALINMNRMLKNNGTLVLSTPFPYSYVFSDETHINVRMPHEWINLLRKTGFKGVRYRHISFIPFFYRFSRHFHIKFSFGLPIKYVNSTIFIFAQK